MAYPSVSAQPPQRDGDPAPGAAADRSALKAGDLSRLAMAPAVIAPASEPDLDHLEPAA
jgi:hypothetical protein